MNRTSNGLGSGPSKKAFAASAGVILLTVLHHFYGAVLYATPWRYRVAFVALPVLAALLGAHLVHDRHRTTRAGSVAMYVFAALSAVFPIGVIGVFEGGYNHLLKNVVFFSGADQDVLHALFPPTRYEMPNDIFFEVTGILQFAVALVAAYHTWDYWSRWLRSVAATPVPSKSSR